METHTENFLCASHKGVRKTAGVACCCSHGGLEPVPLRPRWHTWNVI